MDESPPSIEPQSAPDPLPQPTGFPDSEIVGVGGWLAFFCFTQIIVGPLVTISVAAWVLSKASPVVDAYPLLAVPVGTWLLGNLVIRGFGVYAAISLYRLRLGAVRIAKWYLVTILVWSFLTRGFIYLGSLGLSRWYPDLSAEVLGALNAHALRDLIRALVTFGIWYSYFNVSKRVKATFPASPALKTQQDTVEVSGAAQAKKGTA